MKKFLDKGTEQEQLQITEAQYFRHFICKNCESTAILDVESVNSETQCTQCKKGKLLLLPLVTPYPTYRPGTRLTLFQKEVRAVMHRWKAGWIHEKRQMVVEAGIVSNQDIVCLALSDADKDELFRLCHSKDIPLKVFNWYWRNTLPKFVGNDYSGRSQQLADESTFAQFDSMFDGISKEALKW